jgi:SAM-dependent methyltransferase
MCEILFYSNGGTMERRYYEAYDDRYRQVHALNLQWFDDNPSPIVLDTINKLGISNNDTILELGCGEGRDSIALLRNGFSVTATDISPNVISFCQKKFPDFKAHFQLLDCVNGKSEISYKFIFAIAVVHMLVTDDDRSAFYQFISNHLEDDGYALICSMGDGDSQHCSDANSAFDLQERVHDQTGTLLRIAATTCCIVDFAKFSDELTHNALKIVETGLTESVPGFNQMMYAIVCRHQEGA